MLVYGVEGEKSAATMVKDSKTYIEIAKFVEAYTTIIQNPNEFLTEIGEESINPETDLLSWNQLVKILTTCDLGFEPVPTEKQLVSYYTYARQIGSISKEVKQLATVSDVAEAQKHYYNFVDEETEKVTTMYNKQHEIASNRAKEVEIIDNNLKKIKAKNAIFFSGMMVSVFFIMLGIASVLFDIFGLGSQNQIARYVIGGLFIILGIVGFYVADKLYIKSKRNYFGYHKSTRDAVSRSEKTSLDEKVLRDKLAKYERDLKIAKYELADKEKRFDVEKNIEELRERNRYYRMLRRRDAGFEFDGFSKRRRMSLIEELEASNSESLFSIFGGDDSKHLKRRSSKNGLIEELSDLFRVGAEDGIDPSIRAKRGSIIPDKMMAGMMQGSEMLKGSFINAKIALQNNLGMQNMQNFQIHRGMPSWMRPGLAGERPVYNFNGDFMNRHGRNHGGRLYNNFSESIANNLGRTGRRQALTDEFTISRITKTNETEKKIHFSSENLKDDLMVASSKMGKDIITTEMMSGKKPENKPKKQQSASYKYSSRSRDKDEYGSDYSEAARTDQENQISIQQQLEEMKRNDPNNIQERGSY